MRKFIVISTLILMMSAFVLVMSRVFCKINPVSLKAVQPHFFKRSFSQFLPHFPFQLLPLTHSSFMPIRIETANLSSEASFTKAPTSFVLRFISLFTLSSIFVVLILPFPLQIFQMFPRFVELLLV